MASTNSTTHYELSQYIGTDKPTYLVDYNQDMAKIDAGIYESKSEADLNASAIGTLSNLTTTVKTSLVGAINEVDAESSTIGDVSDLTTTNKSTTVGAINEVNEKANGVGTLADLNTSAKTNLVSAINEVNGNVGNLSSLTTTNKTSSVSAINEVDGDLGNISTLNTTDKSDLTSAVNEVNTKAQDFIDYLTLTDNRLLTNPTIIRGGGTIGYHQIRVALNKDGTAGKIYGRIFITGQNNYGIVKYTNTGIMGVTQTFSIYPAGFTYSDPVNQQELSADTSEIVINPPATGETSASIELRMGNWSSGRCVSVYMPCIYFFKSFGDEGQN